MTQLQATGPDCVSGVMYACHAKAHNLVKKTKNNHLHGKQKMQTHIFVGTRKCRETDSETWINMNGLLNKQFNQKWKFSYYLLNPNADRKSGEVS